MQTVGEIMTKELLTVSPEDSVGKTAELMEKAGIGGSRWWRPDDWWGSLPRGI